jgi:hypothetical protein
MVKAEAPAAAGANKPTWCGRVCDPSRAPRVTNLLVVVFKTPNIFEQRRPSLEDQSLKTSFSNAALVFKI